MVNLSLRDRGEDQPREEPVLIGLVQAAQLLGCSRLQAYKLARARRIPAVQFTEDGGRWMVHKPKLLEQLSEAVSGRREGGGL